MRIILTVKAPPWLSTLEDVKKDLERGCNIWSLSYEIESYEEVKDDDKTTI